jgi:cob(I)alamin adenosyltransferase
MKGKIDYGELEGARMLSPNVVIHQLGREVFVDRKEPDEEDVRMARHGWELAKEAIRKKSADIIVLDEINCVMDYGLIPVSEVVEVVKGKPYDLELILTGKRPPGDRRGGGPGDGDAADQALLLRSVEARGGSSAEQRSSIISTFGCQMNVVGLRKDASLLAAEGTVPRRPWKRRTSGC